MRRIIGYVLLAATAVVMMMCHKAKIDCLYTITPYMIEKEGEPTKKGIDMVAYSFAVDTAKWKVMNYADAVAGTITDKSTNEKRQADEKQYVNDVGKFEFRFKSVPQMLVVCSVKEEMYAWRGSNVQLDLDVMTVSVTFEMWQRQKSYTKGGWIYVYEGKAVVPDTGGTTDTGTTESGANDDQAANGNPLAGGE